MFVRPEEIIAQSHIHEGMKVVDVGTGGSLYILLVGHKVGRQGRVYAVDVQQELLSKIKNAARAEHLENIAIIPANIEKEGSTGIATDSIDKVLLLNVLYQLEDKEGALRECRRMLDPFGELILVDWSESFGNMGPHKDHVFNKEAAAKLFLKNGFRIDRELVVGDYHYGLALKKEI